MKWTSEKPWRVSMFRIASGYRLPWWGAVAWRELLTDHLIVLPIGIAKLAGWIRNAYWVIREPATEAAIVEMMNLRIQLTGRVQAQDEEIRGLRAALNQAEWIAAVALTHLRDHHGCNLMPDFTSKTPKHELH